MHSSTRFNVSILLSLFVVLAVSFIFLGGPRLTTHAAHTVLKSSKATTAPSTSNCGGWSLIPNPNLGSTTTLNGVAAVSANNVWAVGGYDNSGIEQTLIEHWDGMSWNE